MKLVKEGIFYKCIFFLACALLFKSRGFCQARLVLNGAYIKLNEGNSSAPVYLVIDNPDSSAITRNGGHVISESEYNFIRWNMDTFTYAYTFPFGYGTTDYLPFAFKKQSSGSSFVSFSTWSTDAHNNPHPNGVWHMMGIGDSLSSAIDRFWTMQSSAPTRALYTFSYRGSENTTNNPTSGLFSAQYWNTDWSIQALGGSAGVTTGVGSSTLPFSIGAGQYPFVLSKQGQPLPIDILDFKAEWVNSSKTEAEITWRIIDELRVQEYEILRSTDGEPQQSIGILKGQSVSGGAPYSYIDKDLPSGNHRFYYQLKILDFSGKEKLSNAVALHRTTTTSVSLSVYPNPISNYVYLSVLSPIKGEINVELTDMSGRLIWAKKQDFKKGNNQCRLDFSMISEGSYILTTRGMGLNKSFKLVKHSM